MPRREVTKFDPGTILQLCRECSGWTFKKDGRTFLVYDQDEVTINKDL